MGQDVGYAGLGFGISETCSYASETIEAVA